MRYAAVFVLLGLFLTISSGCGPGGPETATVTGTVTLDGKPLPNATVLFQPEQGRPSFGQTDENGEYTMGYSRDRSGVRLGPNTVIITSEYSDENGRAVRHEILPARYHANSELSAVVEKQANVFDFDLSSR